MKDFSALVLHTRCKKFTTARSFYDKACLPCSYQYYRQIEEGQTPEVEVALSIIHALEIPKKRGAFAWARSKMPTAIMRDMFSEVWDDDVTIAIGDSKALAINRKQAELLRRDPMYWEILCFLSAMRRFKLLGTTALEVSEAFKMEEHDVEEMLQELYDHGLIERNGVAYYGQLANLIPPTDEYLDLRCTALKRSFEKHQGADQSKCFRATHTKWITDEQRAIIEDRLLAVLDSLVNMPGEKPPPDSYPYTVGIFAGIRSFGNA